MISSVYPIQAFSELDIPGLIQLSESVGWDYDEAELRTVMAAGTIFGHKNEQQRIVSSAAIIPYEDKLASIGMVIVHPDCRGLGLGRVVTEACMGHVSSDTTIMLIATPQGKPLYEDLGFASVSHIHKYLCDGFAPANSNKASLPHEITPMTEEDLSAVIELDGQAVGSRRSHFLKTRLHQAKTALLVKDYAGKIAGYGFAVQGSINLVAGPIVAENEQLAEQLVRSLLHGHKGKARIDVPAGHGFFASFLESSGFVKASEPPVMVANVDKLPVRSGKYYGIAAQIFG